METKAKLLPSVHLWFPKDSSSCIVPEEKCIKLGPVLKCACCHISVHRNCINMITYECKPTFLYSNTNDMYVKHHWLIRKHSRGKCMCCEKNFDNSNIFGSSKTPLIVICSWCKRMVHTFCFYDTLMVELCDHGPLSKFIVPFTWIVQIDYKNLVSEEYAPPAIINTEATLTMTTNRRNQSLRIPGTKHDNKITSLRWSNKGMRALVIKPLKISSNINENVNKNLTGSIPLIVFINPKSGNTKGHQLLLKFLWLLNPRQVFDLSKDGPKLGLRLFRHVPNLHVLICGGDGTVGWILSEIDKLDIKPSPTISLIPLGTGNDLARFMNWGGGYQDEPIISILNQISSALPIYLDRWKINYKFFDQSVNASNLPSCITNYLSFGADAEVAMEFHESREANPERFNNRFKNKFFYGKAGGMAVIKGTGRDIYKNLNDFIVDSKSIMDKISEIKPQVILFQNISKYAAGTNPWGSYSKDEYEPQSCSDNLIEVVALTSTSMITNQVGGHGIRLAQCKTAKMITNKVITVQVDGEPFRIDSCEITISFHTQARFLSKKKQMSQSTFENLKRRNTMFEDSSKYRLIAISEDEYENICKSSAESIKGVGRFLTVLELKSSTTLSKLRIRLNYLDASDISSSDSFMLKSNWLFVDGGFVVPRLYCIDPCNEDQFSIRDICSEKSIIIVVPKIIKNKYMFH